MMRNPEQTVGNMADKASMALISYIDGEEVSSHKGHAEAQRAGG